MNFQTRWKIGQADFLMNIVCSASEEKNFKRHYVDFLVYQKMNRIENNCKAMCVILRDFLVLQGYESNIVDGLVTYVVDGLSHIGFHTWLEVNGRVIEATSQYKEIKNIPLLQVLESICSTNTINKH